MDISPTPYKTLVDGLYPKLQNLGLGPITEEEAVDIVLDYIRPAIVRFKPCKQNLVDRDDDLQTFKVQLTDEELEIICNYMLIEWLSTNYINVPLLLKPSLTSKDFNVFSPRNHLDGLVNLRNIYMRETRQMVSAYSNCNSGLFDALKQKLAASTETEPEPEII